MITEFLTWHPLASRPDSETTVLLFDPAASEPMWLCYLDSDTWRTAEGMPATPTFWAEMPRGPKE